MRKKGLYPKQLIVRKLMEEKGSPDIFFGVAKPDAQMLEEPVVARYELVQVGKIKPVEVKFVSFSKPVEKLDAPAKKRPGRPRKVAAVEAEEVEETPKRKPGRPKKEKVVAKRGRGRPKKIVEEDIRDIAEDDDDDEDANGAEEGPEEEGEEEEEEEEEEDFDEKDLGL